MIHYAGIPAAAFALGLDWIVAIRPVDLKFDNLFAAAFLASGFFLQSNASRSHKVCGLSLLDRGSAF